MMKRSPDHKRLRQEAEKLIKEGKGSPHPSRETPGAVSHDFTVHGIDRPMRNDELQKLQEELERSLARYADLYHNSPVGYLTLTEKGIISDMNMTAASLLGAGRSFLLDKPFALFVTRDCVNAFYHHRYEVLRSPGKRVCELVLKRYKDPGAFHAQLESVAHQDEGHMVIHTVLTDIAERKHADDALRAQLADTRLLQAVSAELVREDNPQLLYERIVEAAARIMRSDCASMQVLLREQGELLLLAFRGFDPEAAKFWEHVRGDSAASPCGEALRSSARVVVPDVEKSDFMRGSEDLAMFLRAGIRACQATPLFSRAGAMVGMISTHWRERHEPSEHDFNLLDVLARQAADLIERNEAQEALRRAKHDLECRVEERTQELRGAYDRLIEETQGREQLEKELRQAQKLEALGTLTGGIAHDFNNILAAVIGFGELAKERALKGSAQESHLAKLLEAGMRGRDLIKQMLAFSRRTEQVKEPVRLGSLIREAMKLLKASIPSTIRVRVKVENESSLVLADPTQIQQVLMNLCSNAAFAMREKGGALDVALSDCEISANPGGRGIPEGSYVRLTVGDTGTGIPPEIVERVFDPFFTTKEHTEGTGLGLSVVHGIVQHHDGHITVGSEEGKGSVFTVYLPKVGEASGRTDVAREVVPTGRESVLFIDDEETLTNIGRDMLQRLGYEVTVKNNPVEAVAFFRADPARFHLVITDQTMPEMTGLDLAREVLSIRPATPIIMCTGFSHLVDADIAEAAGIAAFVMKPLTRGELARTVRKVLDR